MHNTTCLQISRYNPAITVLYIEPGLDCVTKYWGQFVFKIESTDLLLSQANHIADTVINIRADKLLRGIKHLLIVQGLCSIIIDFIFTRNLTFWQLLLILTLNPAAWPSIKLYAIKKYSYIYISFHIWLSEAIDPAATFRPRSLMRRLCGHTGNGTVSME